MGFFCLRNKYHCTITIGDDMQNIKLSKNFWLSELVKSNTADRLGIDNWPTDEKVINSLKLVTRNVLQPVREYYDIPMNPNSGYRCLELNRVLKSKDTSQHPKGQAIDFEVPVISNFELASWVRRNVQFDQLILEMYNPKEGLNSGWVHCSYVSEDENRGEILTIFKKSAGGGVFPGLLSSRP